MTNTSALAVTISEANQGVDDNWLTSPAFIACRPISDFGETTYTSPTNYYHFEGREEVIERLYYAIEQGDAEMFGRGLHSYQDTFSHSGEGYSNYAGFFGMIELYRECPNCFKDNPVRSGFRSYFQLGHLFAGKSPDTYDLSNPRDVYMTNGTEFWVTLFLLHEAGIDPEIYFQEQFDMSPEEWYKENVGEDLNGQN